MTEYDINLICLLTEMNLRELKSDGQLKLLSDYKTMMNLEIMNSGHGEEIRGMKKKIKSLKRYSSRQDKRVRELKERLDSMIEMRNEGYRYDEYAVTVSLS